MITPELQVAQEVSGEDGLNLQPVSTRSPTSPQGTVVEAAPKYQEAAAPNRTSRPAPGASQPKIPGAVDLRRLWPRSRRAVNPRRLKPRSPERSILAASGRDSAERSILAASGRDSAERSILTASSQDPRSGQSSPPLAEIPPSGQSSPPQAKIPGAVNPHRLWPRFRRAVTSCPRRARVHRPWRSRSFRTDPGTRSTVALLARSSRTGHSGHGATYGKAGPVRDRTPTGQASEPKHRQLDQDSS
jgi:hypothetical protein